MPNIAQSMHPTAWKRCWLQRHGACRVSGRKTSTNLGKRRSHRLRRQNESKGVDDYRSQMPIRSKTLTIHIPEGRYSDRSFVDVFNTTVNKGLEELYGSSTRQMGVNEWPVHYAGPFNPPMFFLDIEEI